MRTHCPQQHEYTPENTYVDANGGRQCKACRRERMRVRRAASPGLGQGGFNSAKTHCPKEHEYAPENTVYTADGRRQCRACARANSAVQRYKRFSLTNDSFAELLAAQENSCKICRTPFTDTPHVDHDHKCCDRNGSCGRCVRGLLCGPCNRLLAKGKDDPALLRSAANYLDAWVSTGR